MAESDLAPVVAVALLALLHVAAGWLRFLDRIPRSRWLSAAGGISVAYVVVHLLPELAHGQEAVVSEWSGLRFLESHVYLIVLAGFTLFYGVELLSRQRVAGEDGGQPRSPGFVLSMASFAVYNGLIGYLLVHREDETLRSLVFFAVALGVHFVVNDHALRERHREAYHRFGRWLLVAALGVGWAIGESTEISEAAVGLVLAFIGGGVILNVVKEELPEERQSRFSAFALGAVGYAVLLQAV